MTHTMFYATLASLYVLITIEAFRLGHRRLAVFYGAVAGVTAAFVVLGLVVPVA